MLVILAWDRDAEDHLGKEHKEVFYVSVNGGKEKALSKAALLQTARTILPERAAQELDATELQEKQSLTSNGHAPSP